jgi:hypothetical protein
MSEFRVTQVLKENLPITPIIEGQFVRCTDSNETFYDAMTDEVRCYVDKVMFLINYTKILLLQNPSTSTLYYDLAKDDVYIRKDNHWIKLVMPVEVFDFLNITIIQEHTLRNSANVALAPTVTTDNILEYYGRSLQVLLDMAENVKIAKHAVRVADITEATTREVVIPYPVHDFNPAVDGMTVVYNNVELDNYTIDAGKLVKDLNTAPFVLGDVILFVFHWIRKIDLNALTSVAGSHIDAQSITIDKLALDVQDWIRGLVEADGDIIISDQDLVDGVSPLGNGDIYIVY